ncbi:MAG: hypothetical protein ABI638_09445 [Ignavibacteriota bacterium]
MKIKILKLFSISLLLAIIFAGCDKQYDTVIENFNPNYQVKLVSPSDSIRYNRVDSLITIRIAFNNFSSIQNVFCDVYAADNTKLNSSPLSLLDNGKIANGDDVAKDGSYANKIGLSEYYPNGIYNIKYFVTDNSNTTKQVALGTFKFDNGQNNIAPVISNLILADSLNVGVSFVFSVLATDQNGYNDILRVYFELYRPDSTLVTDGNGNSKFRMYDDGNLTVYGDQVAGDGIFSFKNSFLDDVSTQRGFWRFEFEAIDIGNKLSNKIIKQVKVL